MRRSQPFGLHAIGHSQRTLLEQLALRAVRVFGGVGRDGASLLGKGEIGITRRVGRLHGRVAGEHSGNAVFLLAPVHIRDAVPGRWLDQVSQPHARAKNVAGIGRLAAAGARSECGQQRAVPSVAADRQIRQPHFRQRTTQLTHGRDGGVSTRHLSEGVVAQVEAAAFQPRPRNAMGHKPAFPPLQAEAAAVKHAIVRINRGNQIVLNVAPILPQQR